MDEVYTFMAELDNNVEYQNKVGQLLKRLNEAKQRQDIMEYKDLYRQLLHKEVDIYTMPYSSTRLFPKDRNHDHDAEFSFDYKGE